LVEKEGVLATMRELEEWAAEHGCRLVPGDKVTRDRLREAVDRGFIPVVDWDRDPATVKPIYTSGAR
jgi:hypothetical protein